MIYTIKIDYDHDSWNKSERFWESVDELRSLGIFHAAPTIEETPVYSYQRVGRRHVDQLAERLGEKEAIAFLSEICTHSYLLVQAESETCPHPGLISAYPSIDALIASPSVLGHVVSADDGPRLLRGECPVFGSVPWGCLDESTNEPDPSIVDVIDRITGDSGPVFAYRIRNSEKHEQAALAYDWPYYVVGDERIDVAVALRQCMNETLREHLLSRRVPFGTYNDNHMDDLYTVSYRGDFWQADDDRLAFMA